jgi:hypothetical protein
LTAGSVIGEFDAIVSPGLELINPNLSVEVEYVTSGPNQGARLSFVPTKLNLEFEDIENDETPGWEELQSWRDVTDPEESTPAMETPTIVHDLDIVNNDVAAQTLLVSTPVERVARLTVGGGASELILAVGDGNTMDGSELLSSLTGATVTNNGAIALNGGRLAASGVLIENGGVFQGNGEIDLSTAGLGTNGKLTVSDGLLDPGFSVGHLDVKGNYEQQAAGTLHVDIESQSQFDTIDVTGEVRLGGTLRIDGSNLALIPDTTIEIMTAGTLVENETFDSVDWIGNEALRSFYYVSYDYDEGTVGLSSVRDLDMNGDQDADPIDLTDLRLFVFALMNSSTTAWFNKCGTACGSDVLPQHHGDFNGNGRVDFDDIGDFQAWVGNMDMPPDEVSAAFERAFNQVPEPSSALLMLVCLSCVALARSRRNFSRK